MYLSVIKKTCNQSANKSNPPIYNPLFLSRVPPYKWQYDLQPLVSFGDNLIWPHGHP
jgi:hypothetical protein